MQTHKTNNIAGLILLVSLWICTPGCADTSRNTRQERSLRPAPAAAPATLSGRMEQPGNKEVFTRGDYIEVVVSFPDLAGDISSVDLLIDGKKTEFNGNVPGSLQVNSSGQPVGTRRINVMIGFDDERTETYSVDIVLKSDLIPEKYSYRIINSYPHDIRAYTQGLVYEGGYLYESTGQYGQSTLRKVDLETGAVLRSLNLDRDLFGEGLCVHDGRLYQLTWKSRVGFIYDIETFRLISRVYYDSEGWGLTSDGTNLLKSDGSNIIYILDPQYFSETGRIEVFDNEGPVDNLNELEFIDGLIYANVYLTDNIVIIEPETGRVAGVIDLTGLLDKQYHHSRIDVLNGIAYDHENERLFVTGKNWPRLFEIELLN
jgi:glutaminyl-peptide cyclotransferase